jgi:hypothetical protein
MEQQNLVARSERIQHIGDECADLFGTQLEALKRTHGIDSPRHLAEAFSALSEENRLMNIGFVGRVKAGKSSLLNALFFDGKSILPKAATPMTAALTTLTYGSSFSAEVELFSAEDLSQIRALANQYSLQFKERQARASSEFQKRFERNGKAIDREEISRLAERQAFMEMKGVESLASAHEQVQYMKESGVDTAALEASTRLLADSPEELIDQLKQYVGANGRYMPFTKIVHVYMPLESLRDIRVIDTPGTNDPVVSREERTVSLLKSCDVVFVISPAGQFLNEDDLNLLNRITLKEGVLELALVASQVDSQLHDSEKRARLDDALTSVRDNLTAQAKRNLTELKRRNPEGADVFGALLTSVESGVLHSAGICLTLETELDSPTDTWGDEELKAWENLAESYPDYFNLENPEFSRVNLAKLGNIPRIQERLEQVRSHKKTITEKKLVGLHNRKSQGLNAYRDALAQLMSEQINLVKSANIGELHKQLETLQSRQLRLRHELDMTYKSCLHEHSSGLREQLLSQIKRALDTSSDKVVEAQGKKNETKTVQKSGAFNWLARKLWDGGSETFSTTHTTAMTGQVIAALESFLFNVETLLSDTSKTARKNLDKSLSSQLTPTVTRVLEEDCNPDLVYRAIVQVVNSLQTESFGLELSLPGELTAQGTLKGPQAEVFMEIAQDFVAELHSKMERKVVQFIQRLEQNIPKDISHDFVELLSEQIRALENQVNNAAQTIDRLEIMSRELEGVSA